VPSVLLTTSGTHALELAAMLLDIRPGDEVIVPSFTFPSTANAFILRGANVVFADIRADTCNIDERQLGGLLSDRTRVVVPMHYGGIGCDMRSIIQTCAPRGVAIVEDNAHGLFGAYRGQPLGTFGVLAAQSFHSSKNFSSGEGGALVISAPELVMRAETLREKGTDRKAYLRGDVDKYTWREIGSSYLPSDLLAALLLAQLEERHTIQSMRSEVWWRYHTTLTPWARDNDVRLPVVPAECAPAFHLFTLLLPSRVERDRLATSLRLRGITAVSHYEPLHSAPMGARLGADPHPCPVADDVSGRLLRLPFFTDLAAGNQDRVIEAIAEFSMQ